MTIFGLHISMTIIWLLLIIIFLAAEALTVGLVSIWFAGGALAALLLSFFDVDPLIQLFVFFAASICLLIFTRKIFVEKLKTGKENTNVDALIGEIGQVVSTINPMEIGQVKVKGQVWSALCDDQLLTLEEGTYVTIKAIEGVKLIVIPRA
ncbi:MAG: NfeD family protein [Firmicutes bacterium]|nr:NfeD family protein [Bacillota bacterium]